MERCRSPATAPGLLHAYLATSDDRAAQWEPVYSIAPRTKAPVVREFVDDEGELQRRLELARWGLHPSWAKDKGTRPINARMETIATNGMFRGPFSSARAVVPMSSYYEWVEAEDGGKDPYVIHHPDGKLLHAAGLIAARKAEDGESWDITFTIVTREARDAGGEVHDQMPVFLTDEAVGEWRRENMGETLALATSRPRSVLAPRAPGRGAALEGRSPS